MIEAIVLVGGKGTRLKSVSGDTPKPLVEVGGKPFLYWLLENLQAHGIKRVVLATGYRSEFFEKQLLKDNPVSVELVFSEERSPLGTGGAIKQAFEYIYGDSALVLNGDSYCAIDYSALENIFCSVDSDLLVGAVSVDDVDRYGSLKIDDNGTLLEMSEKGRAGPGLINSGVYVVGRKVVESIGLDSFSFETEVIEKNLGNITCYPCDDYFVDIGIPEDYLKANDYFNEKSSISRS